MRFSSDLLQQNAPVCFAQWPILSHKTTALNDKDKECYSFDREIFAV